MFTEQQIALALKKERLLGRIDVQRQQVTANVAIFKKPFAAADKLVSGVQFVKDRPWIAGVSMISVLVVGRRRVFTWGARAFTAWRTWRSARRWLSEQGYISQ